MSDSNLDPLARAPPEARSVLEEALREITRCLGDTPLPLPRVIEEPFGLRWSVPEGFVEIRVDDYGFHWSADGRLFEPLGTYLAFGSRIHPEPESPDWYFGLSLLRFLRHFLVRYYELDALRSALLKELHQAEDPRALLEHLTGHAYVRALPKGDDKDE